MNISVCGIETGECFGTIILVTEDFCILFADVPKTFYAVPLKYRYLRGPPVLCTT